jgi:hypothetical protein
MLYFAMQEETDEIIVTKEVAAGNFNWGLDYVPLFHNALEALT